MDNNIILELQIGGAIYDKNTYIGYLKLKDGAMKIVTGEKDNKIINKRNKVLSHLTKVLNGGKQLKDRKIEKYFKALNGKYIRNDICVLGDTSNCKNGKDVSMGGAHKLLKLIAKNTNDIQPILDRFKGSAPVLYERLEYKINGGKIRDTESSVSESSSEPNITNNKRGGLLGKYSKYMKGGNIPLE